MLPPLCRVRLVHKHDWHGSPSRREAEAQEPIAVGSSDGAGAASRTRGEEHHFSTKLTGPITVQTHTADALLVSLDAKKSYDFRLK
jgi:hypothetical protein